MFTVFNTEGFTDDEIEEMNDELKTLMSGIELIGMEDHERIKVFSERIFNRY